MDESCEAVSTIVKAVPPELNRKLEAYATTMLYKLKFKATAVSSPSQAHFVPLCKYRNRNAARGLIRFLEDNEVHLEVRTTRSAVMLLVGREDFRAATKLLSEFQEPMLDAQTKFGRDSNATILIGFVTVFAAGIVTSLQQSLNGFAPVAILINGSSLALLVERWNSRNRNRNGKHFSLADIMRLTALVAINIAIWQMVF